MPSPSGKLTWELAFSQRFNRIFDRLLAALPFLLDPLRMKAVAIETTTGCTRKCAYCPPHSAADIPPLLMKRGTYLSILASLSRNNFSGSVYFNLYGESLLDDRLEDWLGLARAALPWAKLAIFTNGDLLTAARYLALKKSGMDYMALSQHSEQLSARLVGTLEALARDHPGLYNIKLTDYHRLYYAESNRLGVLNNKGGLADVKRRPPPRCRDVESAAVDCLGNVLLCCNDCTSSYVFGNAGETDLFRIWNSPSFTAARRLAQRGKKPFEICRRCMGGEGLSVEMPRAKAKRLPAAFSDMPGTGAAPAPERDKP